MFTRFASNTFMRVPRTRVLLCVAPACFASAHSAVHFQQAACSTPSAPPPPTEVSTRINDMMDSFAESRALINDALESAGTTYFEDDIEEAVRETKQTLQMWSDLQTYLKEKGDEATLTRLVKENEMKMKQLAEELEAAREAGED